MPYNPMYKLLQEEDFGANGMIKHVLDLFPKSSPSSSRSMLSSRIKFISSHPACSSSSAHFRTSSSSSSSSSSASSSFDDHSTSAYCLIDFTDVAMQFVNPFAGQGFLLTDMHLRVDSEYMRQVERRLTPFHHTVRYQNKSNGTEIVVHIYITREAMLLADSISVKKNESGIDISDTCKTILLSNTNPSHIMAQKIVVKFHERLRNLSATTIKLEKELEDLSRKVLNKKEIMFVRKKFFAKYKEQLIKFIDNIKQKNKLANNEYLDKQGIVASKVLEYMGAMLVEVKPVPSKGIVQHLTAVDAVSLETSKTRAETETLQQPASVMPAIGVRIQKLIQEINSLNSELLKAYHDDDIKFSALLQTREEIKKSLWLLQFEDIEKKDSENIQGIISNIKTVEQELFDVVYAGKFSLFEGLFPDWQHLITEEFIFKIFSSIADLSFRRSDLGVQQVTDQEVRANICKICEFLYINSEEYRALITKLIVDATYLMKDENCEMSFIIVLALSDNFDLFNIIIRHGIPNYDFGGCFYGNRFTIPGMLELFVDDPRYLKIIMTNKSSLELLNITNKFTFITQDVSSAGSRWITEQELSRSDFREHKGLRDFAPEVNLVKQLAFSHSTREYQTSKGYYEILAKAPLGYICAVKAKKDILQKVIVPQLSLYEKLKLIAALATRSGFNYLHIPCSNTSGISFLGSRKIASLFADSFMKDTDPDKFLIHIIIYGCGKDMKQYIDGSVVILADILRSIETDISQKKASSVDVFQKEICEIIAVCGKEREIVKDLAYFGFLCLVELFAFAYNEEFTRLDMAELAKVSLLLSEKEIQEGRMLSEKKIQEDRMLSEKEIQEDRMLSEKEIQEDRRSLISDQYAELSITILEKIQSKYNKSKGLTFMNSLCGRLKVVCSSVSTNPPVDSKIKETFDRICAMQSIIQQKIQGQEALQSSKAPRAQQQSGSEQRDTTMEKPSKTKQCRNNKIS